MNCKGGHFSLENIVLGGQYPPGHYSPVNNVWGTIFTGEFCPGGQYSPVNFVLGEQYSSVNNVRGDNIHR